MPSLDHDRCYRALCTKDERFDGRIFVGVRTTGVYCRPVCPARTPKSANCEFFRSAAGAAEAGYRPCLRCRPEAAPDTGAWRGTSSTVRRGLALIAEGALDGPDGSVERLANRLGIGERQLRRLFGEHLGASPVAVAQTRRVHFAKQLIHETRLPMSEVAFAAGFGSIRRFNEVFGAMYGRPPSELRRKKTSGSAEVQVSLRYRPPYDWDAILDFLRVRAIDGVERVEGDRYARTVTHAGHNGTVEVRNRPQRSCLQATIRFPEVRALPELVQNIRRVFDLRADMAQIGAHLSADPVLAPLVAARPGLRVPGAWDGFEIGVRAILGQQVSVEAARKLAGQLVALCGTKGFPDAERVSGTDLASMRMPGARKRAIASLAAAAIAEPDLFRPRSAVDETVATLQALPGIGPWTAQYIALRAAREPDAFPAGDAGLLRAMEVDGARPTPKQLEARAERWRPWRAYAAQYLWTGG